MTVVAACESKTNTTPEFPMGWFSVARSHELLVGEVKRVQAFDRELVLYRTRNGVPVLQDAFCPHLGAHLADAIGDATSGHQLDTGAADELQRFVDRYREYLRP